MLPQSLPRCPLVGPAGQGGPPACMHRSRVHQLLLVGGAISGAIRDLGSMWRNSTYFEVPQRSSMEPTTLSIPQYSIISTCSANPTGTTHESQPLVHNDEAQRPQVEARCLQPLGVPLAGQFLTPMNLQLTSSRFEGQPQQVAMACEVCGVLGFHGYPQSASYGAT